MIQTNNGIVTAAEVRTAGISPSYLAQMVKGGRLSEGCMHCRLFMWMKWLSCF